MADLSRWRARGKWLLGHFLQILVAGGVLAAIIGFALGKLWDGDPRLRCIIFPPVRAPDGMSIQIILFKNSGSKPADSVCIKIRQEQVSSLDYQIEGTRKPDALSRTTEELYLTLSSLAPKETVKLIFKVASSAPPIGPDAVAATFKDGALEQEHIITKRWEKVE